jgi:hypothetical protein
VGGGVFARLLLGIAADVGWRLEQRVSAVKRGPAGTPASGSRGVAVSAILGGIGWLIWPILQGVYGEAGWADPSTAWLLMLTVVGGTWALAGAMIALVVVYADRIRGWVAALGALGASVGALSVVGLYGAFVAMPAASAALLWELGSVGVVPERVSRSHVAIAVLLLVSIAAFVANVALPFTAAALSILILAYAASWIVIGWSLRHAASVPEESARRP